MGRSRVRVGVRRRLVVAAALGLLATAPVELGARPESAQPLMRNTVRGRVTLLEREGVRTTDLENAVVWLEPLGGVAGGASTAGATAPVREIVMEGRRFRPMVRVAAPGSAVPFPNEDPFRHNVFSSGGPGAFDLGLYARGEVRSATVSRAGVYPVFCNIHARMMAYVVAVPTRWHAQAGADGSFAIADVPAGRYRLRAWHDRGGEHTAELAVSDAGAAPVAVTLDASSWVLVPHRNKFGQAYPPESRDRY